MTPKLTKAEILKRAISKAEANGWLPKVQVRWSENSNDIIWRHDFAKALFGKEDRPGCLCDYEDWKCDEVQHNTNAWQFHLQQMVISEDPLLYLSEYLEEVE